MRSSTLKVREPGSETRSATTVAPARAARAARARRAASATTPRRARRPRVGTDRGGQRTGLLASIDVAGQRRADLLPARGGSRRLSRREQKNLLDAMDKTVPEYLARGGSPHTTSAYRGDWRAWTLFCDSLGVDPATGRLGLTVAFVEYLIRQQKSPSTIDRRLAGVSVMLETQHGIDLPRQVTRAARKALANYRYQLGKKGVDVGRGQAVPLRIRHIEIICRYLDRVIRDPATSDRDRLLALRDKAMVLLGFALGARRSELAELYARDVKKTAADLLMVTIRASKTSVTAETIPVLAGANNATDPIRAWLAFDQAMVEHQPHRGRALPGLDGRPDHRIVVLPRMSGRDVHEAVQRLDIKSGLNAGLSGHSFRAGMATEAAEHDAPPHLIMRQGRWKDYNTVLRYVRAAEDPRANSPLAGIGL